MLCMQETLTAFTSGQCHTISRCHPSEFDVGDALPLISAPSSCRKRLRLSSSGGVKLWIDGSVREPTNNRTTREALD